MTNYIAPLLTLSVRWVLASLQLGTKNLPLTGRTSCTTTTSKPIPKLTTLTSPSTRSHHHVGSLGTAHGALGRRWSPQCHQQNSPGTTPGGPINTHSSREPPTTPSQGTHPSHGHFSFQLTRLLTNWAYSVTPPPAARQPSKLRHRGRRTPSPRAPRFSPSDRPRGTSISTDAMSTL